MAWERDHRVHYEIQVHLVSLVLSLVFETVFGIFLSPLACLISVKKKFLEAPNSVLKMNTLILCSERLLGVKNIILNQNIIFQA
jgi:hypothetical protein